MRHMRIFIYMNKKNLILGGVLVVLVGLMYLYQGPLKDWRANIGRTKNILAAVDVAPANLIEITDTGETTVLEKVGDKWLISPTKEFYVKEEIANPLISSIAEAGKAEIELVGENKDNKADFQTDEESGVKVVFKQGETEILSLIVGKLGVDFSSTYIAEPNSDKTYLVRTNLNNVFARSDWYDRTIFSTDKDKIAKIRFQYPTREFTIEKQTVADESGEVGETSWLGTLPYSFEVDDDKISEILNIMSNLTAVSIPEQSFAGTGLEKNNIIVEATGEGVNNTIMVGDAEDEEELLYYIKRGDSDNIYLITKEQRDTLDNQIRDLQ